MTWQASVNSVNLVTLTVPHKATYPTGNSRPAQNSLRLAYFNTVMPPEGQRNKRSSC